MFDDFTLNSAFNAFWVDAERRAGADAYASLRQAFKNGAAFPVARGKIRGEAALNELVAQGDAHALQEMWPWAVMSMKVHHEWGETHQHALIAGVLAALTLWRGGAPLAEQVEAFET